MSLLWIICGAGKGVGKTEVARRLCERLPCSVYAKLGHGEPKPDKSAHYFRDKAALAAFLASRRSAEHLVVESNALALAGKGDVTIFIDGRRTKRRPDCPRLMTAADLTVCAGASPRQWRAKLEETLGPGPLAEEVCGVLERQRQYLVRGDKEPAGGG